MAFTIDSARGIFPGTLAADAVPATIARFNQLNAEDQLALIWFAYEEMGTTITVAAPGAASMILAQGLLNTIKAMSFAEQSQAMCDLANRTDNEVGRAYGVFTPNIKLGFWYQLGEWMAEGTVAPIPEGYQLSANAAAILQAIRDLEQGQQITVLRNTVIDMGYAGAGAAKVSEPVVIPQQVSERTKVAIEGVDNATVLSYINNMNANDFDAVIDLFAPDGALQPPFQRPIVGREAVFRYLQEECQNLKLMPERGSNEPADGNFNQIKVTGKVQTPWFGANVGMNMAWRFLLDPQGKIFFVAIDLLASPKELLNFIR
jgi:Orange carotenoid protein, N-terminal/Nuclear transport factor 2 (NTF2) domain